MKLVGRIEIDGHGASELRTAVGANQGLISGVVETVSALLLRASRHLDAGTFMTLTVTLGGRQIYQTTFGKRPVKRITYRPEDIEE